MLLRMFRYALTLNRCHVVMNVSLCVNSQQLPCCYECFLCVNSQQVPCCYECFVMCLLSTGAMLLCMFRYALTLNRCHFVMNVSLCVNSQQVPFCYECSIMRLLSTGAMLLLIFLEAFDLVLVQPLPY